MYAELIINTVSLSFDFLNDRYWHFFRKWAVRACFLSHDDVVTFTTLLKLLKELIPLSLQPYGVKLFIFRTNIIWSNRIHSLKYLKSKTWDCKDIEVIKSEFMAKIQNSFARFTALINHTYAQHWSVCL